MTSPGLTVVIPAHNEATYLPRYLPTVLASLERWQETSGERGEVIVVDNASTDATADMAASYGVRVISETVRNIGRVRNTGAAAAEGRRLFFTDADVALPMEAITAAATAMDNGAAGRAIHPSTHPSGSAHDCCAPTGTTTAPTTAAHRASPSSPPQQHSARSADTATTCS